MEADISNRPVDGYTTLSRKAWTAYVALVLWSVVLTAFIALISTYLEPIPVTLLSLLLLVWLIYKWLLLRSVRLYYDDLGVWVYQGLLPWNKGLQGVKWRDMDESTFITGFWSWVLRSYTMRISHRFTKDSEILLTQMYKGREASQQINQILMDKVRQQSLH